MREIEDEFLVGASFGDVDHPGAVEVVAVHRPPVVVGRVDAARFQVDVLRALAGSCRARALSFLTKNHYIMFESG